MEKTKKIDAILSHTKHYCPDGKTDYGERIVLTFYYYTPEQEKMIYYLFKDRLLPKYGVFSKNAEMGKDYIMPYLVDKNNKFTTEMTEKIGGTSVPTYLLPDFLRAFMGSKNCNVIIDFTGINDYTPELSDAVSRLFNRNNNKIV